MKLFAWLRSLKRPKAKPSSAPKKRRGRRLPKRLSREEVSSLLEQPPISTWRGLRDRAMLAVLYRAGLRVSEVVKIRPHDLDMETGAVHVWEGKGGVDRVSYLDPDHVRPVLDPWLRERERMGAGPLDPIFCRGDLKGLTTRTVQLMVRRHKDAAGIPSSCTPHVLRHTFASELIEEGFSTSEVQVLLGHASVATTEVYVHVAESRLGEKVRGRGSGV